LGRPYGWRYVFFLRDRPALLLAFLRPRHVEPERFRLRSKRGAKRSLQANTTARKTANF